MGSIIPTVCAAITVFSILALGFLMVITADRMEHNLIGGILLIGGALTLLSAYFAGLFVLVWGEDYLKRTIHAVKPGQPPLFLHQIPEPLPHNKLPESCWVCINATHYGAEWGCGRKKGTVCPEGKEIPAIDAKTLHKDRLRKLKDKR